MNKSGDKQFMLKILLCVVYIILTVSGLVLIKYASLHPQGGFVLPILKIVISKYSFLGLMCYGCSFLLYISVISQFDLGFIIPIVSGVANTLVVIASVVILNEVMGVNSIIGAALVIIGIVVMNLK